MVNDTTEAAEAYVSARDFPRAIRALQSLGRGAGRPDYEATNLGEPTSAQFSLATRVRRACDGRADRAARRCTVGLQRTLAPAALRLSPLGGHQRPLRGGPRALRRARIRRGVYGP